MDDFVIHASPLPRLLPSHYSVNTIGYVQQKKGWVRHAFNSINFSLILSGGGIYRFREREWAVETPCVITQWPDEHVEYGPTEPWHSWEELYLIYSRDRPRTFGELGLADITKPIWKIHDLYSVRARIAQLTEFFQDSTTPGMADRIDHACMGLILETSLTGPRSSASPQEKSIRAIQNEVSSRILEHHDFSALALQHGLSPSTFRRHWAEIVGVPPARYVMQLRIREARRLLVETHMTIGEIAAQLNFNDPLYFSRRFRKETGITATQYREQHRVVSPL